MAEKNSLQKFFNYMAIGFVLSSLRVDILGKDPLVILNDLLFVFMYNLVVCISFGIFSMFGADLYFVIKKNLKNEGFWKLDRINSYGIFFCQ